MVFVHHLLSAESERAFTYNFFATTIVDNIVDNHVPFKNVEKIVLINVMIQNRHIRN